MCNLYSMSKGQQAIRELAGAMRDTTGNLPMLPGIFPDYAAPIVRTGADGVRELVMARWGMPSPAFALQGKKASPQGLCARQRFGGHSENIRYATSLRRAIGSLRVRNSPGESWFALCQR
mgnify:CR=1 FL=1